MIAAIVLAAGESKRMGEENKLLLPYHDKAMIAHVVDTIAASTADIVIVVTGHEHEAIEAALQQKDIVVTHNPDYPEGMSTTIHRGVLKAPPESRGFMICLSDLPRITTADYNLLLQSFAEALAGNPQAIIVPAFQGQRGNPVLFSASYREAILSNRGVVGCRGIVKQNPTHVTRIEMPGDGILKDIDSPDDYRSISS